jgi:peptide/nickel transport system substrate-binding protein
MMKKSSVASRTSGRLSALLTVAPAAAVALVAIAAASGAAAQETPRKGGKLVVARAADITVWDPKFTNDTITIQAQHQIYANLIQNSSDGQSLLPSLAKSYEISPDSKVYTFRLQDDAKFCNGAPITAADVKFSIDRAMEKDSRVLWQFPANPVVETVDPKTVRITLDRPNVAFVSYVTLWGSSVLSKDYVEKVGLEEMGQKPIGSGAFCLDRWVKGQSVTLKPNPGYWDKTKPYLDEVEMRVVQDENAAVLQLRSGQIDIATSVPFVQARALRGASGVVPKMVTLYATSAFVPNVRALPQFQDVKVRQAMMYALDRQAMVDALLQGNGEPAQSPFYGPGVLFHTRDFAINHDLERARKLMAESGFPQGFSFRLTVPSGDEMANQAAVIMNDQLAKIGIRVQVQPTEAGTILQMRSSGNFDMFYKLGSNLVIDPAMNIPFDFWSREEGGSDAAFSGYRNAEIVRLSKEAEGEQDTAKRAAAYRELQRIAMTEVPQIYLFHPSITYATRDTVRGFEIYPTRLYRFAETWKTR